MDSFATCSKIYRNRNYCLRFKQLLKTQLQVCLCVIYLATTRSIGWRHVLALWLYILFPTVGHVSYIKTRCYFSLMDFLMWISTFPNIDVLHIHITWVPDSHCLKTPLPTRSFPSRPVCPVRAVDWGPKNMRLVPPPLPLPWRPTGSYIYNTGLGSSRQNNETCHWQKKKKDK